MVFTKTILMHKYALTSLKGEQLASQWRPSARSYGLSRERVRQLCKRWEISGPQPQQLSSEDLSRAADLIRHGAAVQSAAEEIGTNDKRLRHLFKEAGLDLSEILAWKKAHQYDGKVWGMWSAIEGGHVFKDHNHKWQRCRCECGGRKRSGHL